MRLHILITGRVQGVYFRESTRQQATALGVAGWVRNLPDGRVEAVLDGPADAVRKLVAWCRQGPPGAQVDAVEEREEMVREAFLGFQVRR